VSVGAAILDSGYPILVAVIDAKVIPLDPFASAKSFSVDVSCSAGFGE
jgi:hypothetical protein